MLVKAEVFFSLGAEIPSSFYHHKNDRRRWGGKGREQHHGSEVGTDMKKEQGVRYNMGRVGEHLCKVERLGKQRKVGSAQNWEWRSSIFMKKNTLLTKSLGNLWKM